MGKMPGLEIIWYRLHHFTVFEWYAGPSSATGRNAGKGGFAGYHLISAAIAAGMEHFNLKYVIPHDTDIAEKYLAPLTTTNGFNNKWKT